MDDLRLRGRFGALATTLTLSLLLAACSAGAASAPPSDAPSAPPSTAPDPSEPPGDGGDGGNLAPDGAKIVVPRPGQLDVHPVSAETLTATVDGRRLTVAATWWSGVEPCTILDTVVVDSEDGGFAITLREGRGPEDVACIAIAEQHRTFIEFPNDLDPGTYTIRDSTGGAPPIEVVIP
jgi:hypothetical protein